jgi:hypothetical protein
MLLRKASQDELVLERLLSDRDVDDDTLGFHAQQVGENPPCEGLTAGCRFDAS